MRLSAALNRRQDDLADLRDHAKMASYPADVCAKIELARGAVVDAMKAVMDSEGDESA